MDELKLSGALPSPTGVGLAILRMTQSEDYAMGEITRVIQSDPALTGRIIKLANCSGHASAEPVTAVSDAAMRLGVRTVRNVALGFTLVNGNRSGTCERFDYEGYWSRSLATAVTAQVLAGELRSSLPAEAFTCGLVAGIGRLALASIHPEKYAELLARAQAEGHRDLRPLEREAFNLDHSELAAAMLADWRLPEPFVFAVGHHELGEWQELAPSPAARSMCALLVAAGDIAEAGLVDTPGDQGGEGALRIAASLGLEPEHFGNLCRRVRAEWQEWGAVLRIDTAGFPARDHIGARAERARLEATAAREKPAIAGERRGLRILAVDDDPVSLRLLAHHLTRDGHNVVQATNGREALALALEQAPQMVVTDWMMPELDGVQLCRSLRSTTDGQATYILLVTGREDEERVVEAFAAGADEYVVKPFNPKILLARVRAGQRMIELREQVDFDRRERERHLSRMAVLNRKLEAAAMTDVLTRLPNRRYAIGRLEQELAAARRTQQPLSVIMIDIDHFKEVNDRCGHDMGDAVLRDVGGTIRRSIRRADVACRWGGEEFLVICSGSDLQSCARTAERVRAAVEDQSPPAPAQPRVTVSMGVAALEPGHQTVDDLIKAADRRIYAAKAAGRNVVCWGDAPGQRTRRA